MSVYGLATKGSITNHKLDNLKKNYKNFYFLTLTCNKHPQVHTVDEDIYNIMLSRCGTKVKSCYELNSSGQLHMHSLNVSEKPVYMKELIQQLKKEFPQYHLRIDKIGKLEEVNYCYSYLHKERSDVRPLYYRLARFYEQQEVDKRPSEYGYQIFNYLPEDISELADHGFEYNSNNGRFKYIDTSKTRFID